MDKRMQLSVFGNDTCSVDGNVRFEDIVPFFFEQTGEHRDVVVARHFLQPPDAWTAGNGFCDIEKRFPRKMTRKGITGYRALVEGDGMCPFTGCLCSELFDE